MRSKFNRYSTLLFGVLFTAGSIAAHEQFQTPADPGQADPTVASKSKKKKDVGPDEPADKSKEANTEAATPPAAGNSGNTTSPRTPGNGAPSRANATPSASQPDPEPVGNTGNTTSVRTPPSASSVQHKPPSHNGMVWVNTESGVYHQPGTRYYGKTKQGKYMTEADAIRAGYHAPGKVHAQ
jgi:hypothetical protein